MTTDELIPPSQAVREFATQYRVRTRRDECGELIVPGRRGHVFEHGENNFGVMLVLTTKKRWNFLKRKLVAAEFRLKQNADTEGSLLFDPADTEKASLALQVVRARFRRSISDAQRAVLDRLNGRVRSESSPRQTLVGA